VTTGMSWNTGSCAAESTDGETWSPIAEAPTSHMLYEIARGRDSLIAAAWYRSDLMTPAVYEERGGVFRELESEESPSRDRGGFHGAVDVDGRIALVGRGGEVWSWDDVSKFDPAPDGAAADEASWHGIVRGAGKLLTYGELAGNAFHSAVGIRDEARGAAVRVVIRRTDGRILGATHAVGRFVVVGESGYVAESGDGEAWTERRIATNDLADVVTLR
jgi:hypothetical protein